MASVYTSGPKGEERVVSSRRENASSLDLDSLDLHILPRNIGLANHVVECSARNNRLWSDLPDSIVDVLRRVDDLDTLSICSYTEPSLLLCPASGIGNLVNLQVLILSDNELVVLPVDLANLHKLTELDISRNRFTGIPSVVWSLSRLRKLFISFNAIQRIDSGIKNLVDLIDLDAHHNFISEIDPAIGCCYELVRCDFSYNRLKALPFEMLRDCSQLRRTSIDHNDDTLIQEHEPIDQSVVPSLRELCGRFLVRFPNVVKSELLPDHIATYIASARKCSSCGGPYFTTWVERVHFVEKSNVRIPYLHHLCSRHWEHDEQRIGSLFRALPSVNSLTTPKPALSRQMTALLCDVFNRAGINDEPMAAVYAQRLAASGLVTPRQILALCDTELSINIGMNSPLLRNSLRTVMSEVLSHALEHVTIVDPLDWVDDQDASICMVCEKTAFSVFNRRHHCRKCGLVVCRRCSSRRAFLSEKSGKARVCDPCFLALRGDAKCETWVNSSPKPF